MDHRALRTLLVLGAGLALSGAPRSFGIGDQVSGVDVSVAFGGGLALIGVGLLDQGRGRARIAGLGFLAGVVGLLPSSAPASLLPLLFLGPAAGSALLATVPHLRRTTRAALVTAAIAAALLALAFIDAVILQRSPLPEGLLLTTLDFAMVVGVLLLAVDGDRQHIEDGDAFALPAVAYRS